MGRLNSIATVGVNTRDRMGDPELVKFKTRLEESKHSFKDWRTKIDKYYETYASDPWPDGAKEEMEETGRPPVNFNYSLQVINTVLGEDQANRQEIQYRGVDLEVRDGVVADWMTRLVRYFYAKTDGHRHEAQARLDQLISGYGWTECYMDMTEIPFIPRVTHVPCYEMYPDPNAKDDNLSDAKFIIRRRTWDIEQAKAQWPNHEKKFDAIIGNVNILPGPITNDGEFSKVGGVDDSESETVDIYEYQFIKPEPWVAFVTDRITEFTPTGEEIVIDEGGREDQLTKSEFDEMFPEEESRPLVSAPFTKDVFYRAYVVEGVDGFHDWLDAPKRIYQDDFSYHCITGLRHIKVNEEKTEFFGMMALMYEPQLWVAKILSNTIEMLLRGSKGGGFIEIDALEDPDDFLATQSMPGKWHIVTGGAIQNGKIMERKAITFPSFHGDLLRMLQTAIHDVTGVSAYLQGSAKQERSNVLVSNLQGRSLIALNPISDPYQSYRIRVGRFLGQTIYDYVSDRLINKVINDQGIEGVTAEKVPNPQTGQFELQKVKEVSDILKDADVKNLDIVVDTGTATPTEKQAVWNTMGQVMPRMLEAGMQNAVAKMLPAMAKFLPLPAEIANEISEMLQMDLDIQTKTQTVEGIMSLLPQVEPGVLKQIQDQINGIIQQGEMAGEQAGQPQQG